jgi:AcrR family transcriptional regulator/AraC-like DNA-binding protein
VKSAEGAIGTKSRILNAGIDLWGTQPIPALFGGFSVARVAEAAHVTRSTFYSYWPSTDEYLHELVAHLIEIDGFNYPAAVAKKLSKQRLSTPGTDVAGQIVESCTLHLQAAIDDPTLAIRLGLLSKADDPEISEILRSLYRTSETVQNAPLLQSLDDWGRVLREPFDLRSLQLVYSALIEGIAARHRLDPQEVPLEVYGWAMLPLLVMTTRRPEDERSLFELVDSVNSWPAAGLADKLHEHKDQGSHWTASITPSSMREVTVAVRRLLTRIGFGELSIPEIAGVTGYSESTMQQMFGSLPGVALCVYFINIHERYQETSPQLRGMERLRELIAINFDELLRNPAIAQNLLLLLSGHHPIPRLDLIEFDPRPHFESSVIDAVDAGELDSDIDPIQFSEVLHRTMLFEGTRLSPSTSTIDTLELLLRGAGAESKVLSKSKRSE